MRHLVADPVGAPPERQLGEVAGAEHDAAALVRRPEQVVGAQAGLHVLEGDVVDLLAPAERVPEVREHLGRRGADVELLPGDAERLHEVDRVRLRTRAGGEPRHREAADVGARQAEPVARLGRDDEGVGGVEAAGDADDDRRHPGLVTTTDGAHPLLQAGDLDVVRLVAVQGQPRLSVGHEREAVDVAPQAEVARGRAELERHDAEAALVGGVRVGVVVEAALAQALLPQPVEVDVDDGAARAVGEAVGLAEQRAHLVDHRHAVPRQVGRRLTWARGGVQVGGVAPRARRAGVQVAVLGAPDGDRGGRQVEQHGGPGQRRLGRR